MKQIITISRQYGSGGHEIGKKLAEKLGYAFYDKEILRAAAHRLGISQAILEDSDESRTTSLLYSIVTRSSYSDTYEDKITKQENRFLRQQAEKGPCVIIGRCANKVLADEPGLLSVFITAPMEARVARIVAKENLSEEAAAKRIRSIDRKRASYYSYRTGASWANADQYHLVVDRTLLGMDGTVELLEALAKKHKDGE